MTSKAAQTLSLLEVKSIIFGLSVFNFMFIWVKAERDGGMGGALVPPWYNFWHFTNEPSRLLLAAALLWLSRKWSYALAAAVSGFIVGQLLYIFTIIENDPCARSKTDARLRRYSRGMGDAACVGVHYFRGC
jgi:hypothetical protein